MFQDKIVSVLQLSISGAFLFSIVTATSVLVCILLFFPRHAFPKNAPPLASGSYPVLGAWTFFKNQNEFHRKARLESPTGNFSYYFGNRLIIGLTGDSGRQAVFESKQLDFLEGHAIRFSATMPQMEDEEGEETDSRRIFSKYSVRSMIRHMSGENLSKVLPALTNDTKLRLQDLANKPSGITDPFNSFYSIIFQLTMRTFVCSEIAEDLVLLEKTMGMIDTIEQSSSPTSIIFPWLPTFAGASRTIAGARLYFILEKIIAQRKKSGTRRDDPLQELIDRGENMRMTVAFVIASLITAYVSSTVNAGWFMVYLATNSEWMAKAREEIIAAVLKGSPNSDLPLVDRLSLLSLNDWENEFPVLDLCLKETLRLQSGIAFRKNISGRDLKVGKEIVPSGAFVTYSLADVHFNPSVYPEPEKWEPARYISEKGEDSIPLPYLGWGAGRHPCLGTRFAKLEQRIVAAYSILMYDWELCDEKGIHMSSYPPTNGHGYTATRPKKPVFLKYRKWETS